MKKATFKKNDVIIREGKKWQCVVCDEAYACFAGYTRVSPDQEHTDFNEVFLTINNAEQHFEFEKVGHNFGNEN
jgi:hypothetical protein